MSTYFSSIPQATDNPSDSQPLILSNFEALNNAISRNHTPMSDTANSGKHEFMQMPQQTSAPSTGADEGGLYTQDVSGSTQLFYREESNGAERQLTGSFLAATNGAAEIAGGLTIQWGTLGGVLDNGVITFTQPFVSPAFNVQLSELRTNNSVRSLWVASGSITATQFKIRTNDTLSITVLWFAIGV